MNSTWHDNMAEAVNLRKKAINGVARWQEKLAEAEAAIVALSSQRPAAAKPADVPLFPDPIMNTLTLDA